MSTEARVLIVEGNNALRAMLFTVLRHQPLAVDTAVTCDEAIEKVEGCDYALVLIDMNLPNGEGPLFLRRFPQVRPDANTFVIAVRDPVQDVTIDPRVASAILNKPIEIDTLAEVVRECAFVVPPPEEPSENCPPAESEIRLQIERGGNLPN